MPYADVNDIRLYDEEQGQGEPIVLDFLGRHARSAASAASA